MWLQEESLGHTVALTPYFPLPCLHLMSIAQILSNANTNSIECIQILANKNRNSGDRPVVNLLIVENTWTTKSVQNHNQLSLQIWYERHLFRNEGCRLVLLKIWAWCWWCPAIQKIPYQWSIMTITHINVVLYVALTLESECEALWALCSRVLFYSGPKVITPMNKVFELVIPDLL